MRTRLAALKLMAKAAPADAAPLLQGILALFDSIISELEHAQRSQKTILTYLEKADL